MSADDGTFRCTGCRTPLNHTDRVCWKCGSDKIEDCRPFGSLGDGEQPPAEEPIILEDSILNALKNAQVMWVIADAKWEIVDLRDPQEQREIPIEEPTGASLHRLNKYTVEKLRSMAK